MSDNNITPPPPKLMDEAGLAYLVTQMQAYTDNKVAEAQQTSVLRSGSKWKDLVDVINRICASSYGYDVDPEDLVTKLTEIFPSGPFDPGNTSSLEGLTFVEPIDSQYVANILSMKTKLKSIESGAVTTIGNNAFQSCTALTLIDFPICTYIGGGAFQGCTALTLIDFPICTYIGGGAFQGCTALTSVNFPNCTFIEQYAFQSCSSLTLADFQNCTSLGNYAFQSCTALTLADFQNCTSLGNYAFQSCSSLTLADFQNCTSLGLFAFQSCTSLASINIPNCVSINLRTFDGCTSLKSINCKVSIIGAILSHAAMTSLYRLYIMDTITSSFNLSTWNPTIGFSTSNSSLVPWQEWDLDENGDPIDCSQFQTNADKALWCFKHLTMPAFADMSGIGGVTLTLKSTVYDVVMVDQDVQDYFANNGWTVARVA